ncbi:EF-hand domain-containing protein [Nitratireductor kimnyeongensis]|uniref:EF-hand domain-containing protein n=1 Tax=Nitratireductor kimnyeongensis TaxID=430679 RepID=A0ABW0T943_9HYPH|nr:acid-shock protein [Nitratireductor kimnyeongensis]QZZ35861.1 acid-shock protein [Nitratireductor kimnyeongensis]
MKKKILLTAMALSLMAGSAAIAQETNSGQAAPQVAGEKMKDGKKMRGFSRLDKDGDGAISAEEFSAVHIERLKAADADGDGVLSDAELQDMAAKRMADRRAKRAAQRLDVDGDGTVTIAEIESQQAKRFALMDANDDGKVDQREMRRGFRQMAGERGGHHGKKMHHKRDHRGGPRGDMPGKMRPGNPPAEMAPDADNG